MWEEINGNDCIATWQGKSTVVTFLYNTNIMILLGQYYTSCLINMQVNNMRHLYTPI